MQKVLSEFLNKYKFSVFPHSNQTFTKNLLQINKKISKTKYYTNKTCASFLRYACLS